MVRKLIKPAVGHRAIGGRSRNAARSEWRDEPSSTRQGGGRAGDGRYGDSARYGDGKMGGARYGGARDGGTRSGGAPRGGGARGGATRGGTTASRDRADRGTRYGGASRDGDRADRTKSADRIYDERRSRPVVRKGDRSFGPRSFDAKGRRDQQRLPERVEQGDFILGRRAVMEALKGGRELNKLLVQDNASGGSFAEILYRAKEQSVVVQTVPRAKLDEITQRGNHQGVVAYVAAKAYVELDELIALAQRKKPGLLVMLDGIEDPHNLGSILRSADAAGAVGVIIPKRRAVPLTATVAKASAGALEHVEVARVVNLSQAIDALKEAGFWIVGADAKASVFHWQADFTMPTVLVIGNEGEGLARLTTERCDMLVKLPMQGQVDSLNAGVAAGILLYEAVRQRARGRY